MNLNPCRRIIVAVLLGLASALSAPPAWALQRGQTEGGIAWVSGGVGLDEIERLQGERSEFSFWLITAALRSGAYLAGVRVRIVEAESRRVVLEQVLDGPWLLARLPLGRYEVEAIHHPPGRARIEVQRGTTTIHPNDHHQMVLYFVLPEGEAPEPAPR